MPQGIVRDNDLRGYAAWSATPTHLDDGSIRTDASRPPRVLFCNGRQDRYRFPRGVITVC